MKREEKKTGNKWGAKVAYMAIAIGVVLLLAVIWKATGSSETATVKPVQVEVKEEVKDIIEPPTVEEVEAVDVVEETPVVEEAPVAEPQEEAPEAVTPAPVTPAPVAPAPVKQEKPVVQKPVEPKAPEQPVVVPTSDVPSDDTFPQVEAAVSRFSTDSEEMTKEQKAVAGAFLLARLDNQMQKADSAGHMEIVEVLSAMEQQVNDIINN